MRLNRGRCDWIDLKNVGFKECPYCGGTEFGEGYQRDYVKLITGAFYLDGENLYHIVCINYGGIVRSYVKHLDKFKK